MRYFFLFALKTDRRKSPKRESIKSLVTFLCSKKKKTIIKYVEIIVVEFR